MTAEVVFVTKLVVQFPDGARDEAVLIEPLAMEHSKFGGVIVQEGFETDFASVPGWVLLPGIVPRKGKIRNASVIHDWIYRGHEGDRFTRAEADQIMLDAAIACGMDAWRAKIAWLGVRVGGWAVWKGAK